VILLGMATQGAASFDVTKWTLEERNIAFKILVKLKKQKAL